MAVDIDTNGLFDEVDPNEAVSIRSLNDLVQKLVLRIGEAGIDTKHIALGVIPESKLSDGVQSQLGVVDGSVTTDSIVDGAVSNAKLIDMPPMSVKLNNENNAAAPSDLSADEEYQMLHRDGDSLVWKQLDASTLLQGVVGATNYASSPGSEHGFKAFFTTQVGFFLSGSYTSGATLQLPERFSEDPFVLATLERVSGPDNTIFVDEISIGTTSISPQLSRPVGESTDVVEYNMHILAIGQV